MIALCLSDFRLLTNRLETCGMVGGDAYEMRLALGITPWDLMGRHGKPLGDELSCLGDVASEMRAFVAESLRG